MSRLSTVARSSFSPARNVRSTVEPVFTFLRRVRTNAAPLPGLTCKNSMTVQRCPSMMMVTPLRKSLELIIGALRLQQREAVFRPVPQPVQILAVPVDDDARGCEPVG